MNPAKKIVLASLASLSLSTVAHAQTTACASLDENSKIATVGGFTNMQYTEEHAYGYTVMLWRADKCLFGLFLSSDGLAGDTPTGEVRDLQYDENTGAISFSAKLTTGSISYPGSKGEEISRNLFAFRGTLRKSRMTGVVTFKNLNAPRFAPEQTKVILRASRQEAESMDNEKTYGEWRKHSDEILKFRGPKW